MCRDQYTKQMYAFERSKVTSMAKIESDIAMADKPRMLKTERVGRKSEKHDC